MTTKQRSELTQLVEIFIKQTEAQMQSFATHNEIQVLTQETRQMTWAALNLGDSLSITWPSSLTLTSKILLAIANSMVEPNYQTPNTKGAN